jgi:hypothetical protein
MTTQNDINKDMVSLVGSLSDGINQLRKAVELLAHDLSSTIYLIYRVKGYTNLMLLVKI